jgi:hypothetical protein
MEEKGRPKLAGLYAVLMDDKRKYQELLDNIDMVLVRIRKDLGIEVYEEEKNG